MPKTAIIYARVSSQEQKELGTIDQQIQTLRDFADSKKYSIVETVQDEAISGKDIGRAVKLINLAQRLKPDMILITKFDRLSRRMDLQYWCEIELERIGIKIVAIEEKKEGNDPKDVLLRQILSAFSEFERALIRERMDEGMDYKAKIRKQPPVATPPFGYKYDDKGNYVIVPEEAEIVKSIFIWKARYGSVNKILRIMKERGVKFNGKETSKQALWYMLKNTKYIAKFRYKGEMIDGAWEPIIPIRIFRQVQGNTKKAGL